MVALTEQAPYSKAESDQRSLVARHIHRQDLTSDVAICLPWSKRSATRILAPSAFDRLTSAFEQVKELGISKTVLLEELDSLWLVNVARHPEGIGFRVTWRFIC